MNWISTKDAWPADLRNVIVFEKHRMESGYVYYFYYISYITEMYLKERVKGKKILKRVWNVKSKIYDLDRFHFWMSIPEPPPEELK